MRPREAPLRDLPSGDGAAVNPSNVGLVVRPEDRPAERWSRRPEKVESADLKVQYRTMLLVGFALSLGLLVALTYVDVQFDAAGDNIVFERQEVVTMQEIQQTQQAERVPLPPRPPTPVEVPNDQIIDDEPLNLDASLDLNAALDVPSAPPPPPEPMPEEANAEDEQEIFIVVEERPEMIGGMQSLYDVIRYPSVMRNAGIEGRVIVQFIVDEEGNVVNPVVLQSPHSMLSEEALRAVQLVKFIPGRQRSKAVRVQMSIPIIFRLEESKR